LGEIEINLLLTKEEEMEVTKNVPADAAGIKSMVREKYGAIAGAGSSCCGGGCGSPELTDISEDYSGKEGYLAEADLGLGCGLPTESVDIRKGDVVLDLGSGAGNDAFVARALAGEEGRVIGVDMTPAMVDKARANARKLGAANVEFRLGEIEHLPVENAGVDVIISNCVLNLAPEKAAVFAEMRRVLKPGGRFSVSDVVLAGELPDPLRLDAELYAGCVSGAVTLDAYLEGLRSAGFEDVTVTRKRPITLPREVLDRHLAPEQAEAFASGGAVLSVTVSGRRPPVEGSR
jgi:SAM-dependent methyltransferase